MLPLTKKKRHLIGRDGVLLLKRSYRLTKNKDFQAVYKRKNSVAAGAVVLYIKDSIKDATPRVGFSVSKKVGNAVKRNRCRRLMREAVRTNIEGIRTGKDYVFIGRQSIAKAGYKQIEKDILRALERKGCLV